MSYIRKFLGPLVNTANPSFGYTKRFASHHWGEVTQLFSGKKPEKDHYLTLTLFNILLPLVAIVVKPVLIALSLVQASLMIVLSPLLIPLYRHETKQGGSYGEDRSDITWRTVAFEYAKLCFSHVDQIAGHMVGMLFDCVRPVSALIFAVAYPIRQFVKKDDKTDNAYAAKEAKAGQQQGSGSASGIDYVQPVHRSDAYRGRRRRGLGAAHGQQAHHGPATEEHRRDQPRRR